MINLINYFKEKIKKLKEHFKKNPYLYKYIFFWLFFILLITIIFYYINIYKKEIHYNNILKEAYTSNKLKNKDNLVYIPPTQNKIPLSKNSNRELSKLLEKKKLEPDLVANYYDVDTFKVKTIEEHLTSQKIPELNVKPKLEIESPVKKVNLESVKIDTKKEIKEILEPMLKPVINEIQNLKYSSKPKSPEIERYSVPINQIRMNQPMMQPMNQPMMQPQIPKMNQPINNGMMEVRLDNLVEVINANPPSVHVEDTQFNYDL